MPRHIKIPYIVSLLLSVLFQSLVINRSTAQNFNNYEEFAQSSVPKKILIDVIARNGKSKTYNQVFALDGGTVGIANFAVGGLSSLYKLMNTEKYFKKSREEMILRYSAGCRSGKHRGNDTGWGCYSKSWWRSGMRRFVNSPETYSVQDKAWLSLMKPTITLAIEHNWIDGRRLAIATGIANSLGGGGFKRMAQNYSWRAERVLSAYAAGSDHWKRRRDAINKAFPK